MNNKEKIVKKLLFEIIDKLSKNADVYYYNESLWLIHTEDRKWIIEFTEEGTLWYNYNFFRSAFKFVSLEVQDNKQYVSDWFESRFLNKPKVEDTIQNGVKHTEDFGMEQVMLVEDTIQNGVKHTFGIWKIISTSVEDTIQNGVKHTQSLWNNYRKWVEDAIQNGVKHTSMDVPFRLTCVEDTIQNGVKHISEVFSYCLHAVDDTIQNGFKENIKK